MAIGQWSPHWDLLSVCTGLLNVIIIIMISRPHTVVFCSPQCSMPFRGGGINTHILWALCDSHIFFGSLSSIGSAWWRGCGWLNWANGYYYTQLARVQHHSHRSGALLRSESLHYIYVYLFCFICFISFVGTAWLGPCLCEVWLFDWFGNGPYLVHGPFFPIYIL
jgi:hypothetical protein